MSRRSRYRAGAAALGVLGVLAAVGVGVGAVTIGIAEAGGTAWPGSARLPPTASASVLDANVVGPAAAVTEQVTGAAQRQTAAHWTRRRMRAATAAPLPRILMRTASAELRPGRLRSRD